MRVSEDSSSDSESISIERLSMDSKTKKLPPLPGPPSNAGWSPIAPKGSQLVFPKTRFTFLTPSIIRIESSPVGVFEDRASTFAVNRNLPTPNIDVTRKEEGAVEVTTDKLRVIYDGKELTENGLYIAIIHKLSPTQNATNWRWGQEARGNLGGTYRTLDTVDGRVDVGDGILSQNGFAIIDDSTTMMFTADGWVDSRVAGRTDHYVFAYGLDYAAAMRDYYVISGAQPVVPRWALGNWWSRYHPFDEKEYLGLMDKFRYHGIPMCVGVVDMDWHLVHEVPEKYGSGWTGYTWNKQLFPDPKRFIKGLHDRKMKMTPNTHPADGFRAFEDVYAKACELLGRDPKAQMPIEFDCTDAEFMSAYFKIHHMLEEDGIDFWWLDWQQGNISKKPGVDPLWVLNHFHYWDSASHDRRPITFSRFGGPGSQRYPIGFSGDAVSSWDSLEFQPEFTATAANIGYGWWSHDIGGHWGGTKDHECYTRWVQLGLWSPILRLHCNESIFASREPWRYNSEAEAIVTKTMRYRNRLIPYLYTMGVRSAKEGRCICEPMYHAHPTEPDAYYNKRQYYFGSELIVSPITQPRDFVTMMGRTDTWLPNGKWVDIFAQTVYDGGRVVSMFRTLDAVPVLARPGAIIPLDLAGSDDTGEHDACPENGAPLPTEMEIIVVVGADGEFELLEDDGSGGDLTSIEFSKTPISYKQTSGRLTIGPTKNPLVKERKYCVRLPCFEATGDFAPQLVGASANLSVTQKVAGGMVILDIPSVSTDKAVTIDLGGSPSLKANDVSTKVFAIMDRGQFNPQVKDKVWDAVEAELGKGRRHILLSRLEAIDFDAKMRDAVLEQILAE